MRAYAVRLLRLRRIEFSAHTGLQKARPQSRGLRTALTPYLLRLEPMRACPREAEAFPEVLPIEELRRVAAGPVFLHVGTSLVDPTENW